MFIVGLRKLDRVRGDGWLDCPNCHEHAAQDVVDEMRFASLTFYRFTPVSRHRTLRCRRCSYRRPATIEEMSRLKTAGKRVGRAWLAPVGLSPFIAAALVVLVVLLRSSSAASSGVTYATVSAVPVAPVTLEIPPAYNHSAIPPESPTSAGLYVASQGTFTLRLRRYPVALSPTDTLNEHFNDDVGILSGNFPDKPPAATATKVGGQDGVRTTIKYLEQGAAAVLDLYAFNHDGVAYMISFLYIGAQGQAEADANLAHIVESVKFTATETPPPSTGTSSSSSASATPSPTH